MDLQDDIGAGGDELGLPGFPRFVLITGYVSNQELARRLPAWNADRSFDLGRGKRRARLMCSGRIRIVPLNDDVHVVHPGPVFGPNLGSLHPFVFGEPAGDQDVGDIDDAFSRNLVGVRHLDHGVGLSNVPPGLELLRLRQIA